MYRVKGANFKKPLPRLSVPRCGGIKIQKDESTSSWKLERHRKERAGRRGEERAKSAKKGKCLGLVNFLVICVPPCRFELPFLSDRESSPLPPASFYLSSFSSCSNEKIGEILLVGGIRKNRSAEAGKIAREMDRRKRVEEEKLVVKDISAC